MKYLSFILISQSFSTLSFLPNPPTPILNRPIFIYHQIGIINPMASSPERTSFQNSNDDLMDKTYLNLKSLKNICFD